MKKNHARKKNPLLLLNLNKLYFRFSGHSPGNTDTLCWSSLAISSDLRSGSSPSNLPHTPVIKLLSDKLVLTTVPGRRTMLSSVLQLSAQGWILLTITSSIPWTHVVVFKPSHQKKRFPWAQGHAIHCTRGPFQTVALL